jgi:hypothetical protein
MIFDIPDANPGLFPHLSHNGIFKRLSRLEKAGEGGIIISGEFRLHRL